MLLLLEVKEHFVRLASKVNPYPLPFRAVKEMRKLDS